MSARRWARGREADAWLTRALGEPVRLVRAQPQMRAANAQYAGPTPAPIGFPDGYPVLVVNAASLADLNTRLPQPMPMERFRPNVVLEGLPAWAEDRIAALTAGPVTLRLVKPCLRCSIPTFDHLTGEPAFNVLPVLKSFRFSRALHGVMFGENAVIEHGTGEELRRGDAVRIAWDALAPHLHFLTSNTAREARAGPGGARNCAQRPRAPRPLGPHFIRCSRDKV